MSNKEFGRQLYLLRKYRYGLTQEQVSASSDDLLSIKVVQDLEQGRVKHVNHSHLEPIADALKLNEESKEILYSMAGLQYTRAELPGGIDLLKTVFRNIPYPAIARTPLWDVVCFNSYYSETWGFNQDDISTLHEGPIAPNLLSVLFESNLRKRGALFTSEDMIRSAVNSFQATSIPYVNSDRYNYIMNYMMRNESFVWMWERSLMRLEEPSSSIHIRSEFGEINLLPLQLSPNVFGGDLDIEIYVPLTQLDNYRRLTENIVYTERIYTFETVR